MTVPKLSFDVNTLPDKKKLANKIIRALKKEFPVAECALTHDSAFQLLTATILSAQCTDERVNIATEHLFKKYPTAKKLANAKLKDVEAIVQSLGFFRAKARNIVGMAQGIVENHRGEIPENLEELIQLPGVGRKTANVVLGTWFGIPSGVVVDTHVKRISRLFGLTEATQPEAIERDLQEILPEKEWIEYSHRVIYHGRKWCPARRPKCTECPLLKICPRNGLSNIET